jgi:chitin synthase
VAVVLMQDGILKLVADRQKRTFAKGKTSMVEFFRALDEHDGKPKCDLEERINTILDEIDNYNRRGMGGLVASNRDFPPSIEKSISLLYQNLWHPGLTDPERSANHYTKKIKIFSCFKHLNGTKLSSHLWFFEGFCRYLNPEFIVLLDVGTKPESYGVSNLIRGFNGDPDVGGVTGLMSVDANFPSEEGGGD